LPSVIYLLCNNTTLQKIFCLFDTTLPHPSIQKELFKDRQEISMNKKTKVENSRNKKKEMIQLQTNSLSLMS